MSQPVTIAMYSDLHCPYAYVTAFRLRKLRDEFRGRVCIQRKSLALEYVNKRPTPKGIVDNETTILMLEEADIPFQPWHPPDSEWPVTMWPAFEAVKCAERQDLELADDLDWAIREAFFAHSRCISMRHVLLELAEGVGLDMARFEEDFDGGVAKRLVLREAQEGWERLQLPGSPTFVLPGGEQRGPYLGLPKLELDPRQHFRVVSVQPPSPRDGDGLTPLRRMLADAQEQD